MNILVLTSTYPRTDTDTLPAFVHELCRRLAQAGHTVHVLTPRLPGGLARQQMDGVAITRFGYWFPAQETLTGSGGIMSRLRQRPWRIALVPIFMARMAWALFKALRAGHYDLVHAHWLIPQGILAALLVPVCSSASLICTAHGSDIHALRGRNARRLRHLVLRRAALASVVSDTLRDELISEGVSPNKIVVAPMGVDLHGRFVPVRTISRQAHHIVFVGRLIELKGVHVLLEAFAGLKIRYPGATLEIIGEGPARASLERLAHELDISPAVTFAGALSQEELPPRYSAASIAAVTSLAEGFGLVAVEAMGCGCAVVASALPSLKSIIVDGETGLLFPPGDVSALSAALARLLQSPTFGRELAEKGRHIVLQTYDWSVATKKYIGFYRTIVGEDVFSDKQLPD